MVIQKDYVEHESTNLELDINVHDTIKAEKEEERKLEVILQAEDYLFNSNNEMSEKVPEKKVCLNQKPPKIYCYEKIPLTDESQIKPKVEELTEKVDGHLRCKFCGKTTAANKRNNHNDHVESHFEGLSFPCSYCPKTFKTRNSQRTHKYRDHKDLSQQLL